jgi:hypothetical protein
VCYEENIFSIRFAQILAIIYKTEILLSNSLFKPDKFKVGRLIGLIPERTVKLEIKALMYGNIIAGAFRYRKLLNLSSSILEYLKKLSDKISIFNLSESLITTPKFKIKIDCFLSNIPEGLNLIDKSKSSL